MKFITWIKVLFTHRGVIRDLNTRNEWQASELAKERKEGVELRTQVLAISKEIEALRRERQQLLSTNHAGAAQSRADAVNAHWDNMRREEEWKKNRGDMTDREVAAALANRPSITPGHHHNSPVPK